MTAKFKGILVLTLALSIAPSAFGQNASDVVLYEVAKVHTGSGVLSPGMVLVEGGRIKEVGSSIALPTGARRVRIEGAEITAGLIDAAAAGFSSAADTEDSSEILPGDRVIDALDLTDRRFEDLAREGVTTVFVTASLKSVVGPQGAVLKTGPDVAHRVVVAAGDAKIVVTNDPSAGNGAPRRGTGKTFFTRRPTSHMGVNFVARDAFAEAREMLAADPSAAQRDPSLAVFADLFAKKRSIRACGDEQFEIATALRIAGEFGFSIIVERGVEAWRYREQLAASKTPVICGPVITPPPVNVPARFRRFVAGPSDFQKPSAPRLLVDAKVTTALTANGGMREQGLVEQVREAMRYGLSAEDALASVTTTPATLLGLADRVGKVASGMDADLVIWSGAPFGATSAIKLVVVGGRRIEPAVY